MLHSLSKSTDPSSQLEYRPVRTPLIVQIRGLSDHGWIGVDGMQVLPEQGTVQFEFFTGRKAPRDIMSQAILQASKQLVDGIDFQESSSD
jgi:shikimate 5-dehydrogenase